MHITDGVFYKPILQPPHKDQTEAGTTNIKEKTQKRNLYTYNLKEDIWLQLQERIKCLI